MPPLRAPFLLVLALQLISRRSQKETEVLHLRTLVTTTSNLHYQRQLRNHSRVRPALHGLLCIPASICYKSSTKFCDICQPAYNDVDLNAHKLPNPSDLYTPPRAPESIHLPTGLSPPIEATTASIKQTPHSTHSAIYEPTIFQLVSRCAAELETRPFSYILY